MAFNNFPYTDMHELNMDWVILRVKELVAAVGTASDAITDMREDIAEFETETDNKIETINDKVDNFIANLDLDDAVAQKLQQMKADGSLDQIISEALGGSSTVHICGAKGDETHSGIVLRYGSHCVVHDFGFDKPLVKEYVLANNLTVDAIIISHYHSDHIGQNGGILLQDFVNSVTLSSTCVAYLPHHLLDWDSTTFNSTVMRSNETAVVRILTDAGITIKYPEQGGAASHAGFYLRFYNLSQSNFNAYRAGPHYNIYGEIVDVDQYNNYSMIVTARSYGKTIYMPGDIQYEATARNTQGARDADIYCIEHHSNNVVTSNAFLTNLRPKYAVIQHNVSADGWTSLYYQRATASYLAGIGTAIKSTYDFGNIDFTLSYGGIDVSQSSISAGTYPITDTPLYGNGLLAKSNLNTMQTPGSHNLYNFTDYDIVNMPDVLDSRNTAAIIRNKLVRPGSRDVQQTVEMANVPFMKMRRYIRDASNFSDWYASVMSPYICERIARTDARWQITPSETAYGVASCMLSCINGILTFAAVCQFDNDITGAPWLFDTRLPTSNFLSSNVYGTGYMIPLSGGDALPLRAAGDTTIKIYSNAIIPANTVYVMSLTMPYFG